MTLKSLCYKFIYIDEACANETSYPLYGYSKKNTPYVVTTGNKSKKISVLLCITEDTLLNCQLFDGSVSGEDYGAFILNVIKKNEEIRLNLDKYIWYMDNC